MTFSDFIAKYGITMDTGPRPALNESPHDMTPYKFNLQLRHSAFNSGSEPLHVEFSQGVAHLEYRIGRFKPWGKRYLPRNVSLHDWANFRPAYPELVDVMACLQADVSVVDSRTFELWASELGFDSDSRSAYDNYQVCRERALDMIGWLGYENVGEFLKCHEE